MRKFYRFLCKAEEVACGVGFAFLILFIFISAVLRFFKLSMSWYIDLAMLCLAWTSFIGADVAWRHGQILGVDLLTRVLPKPIRRVVELVVLLIILATLVVIVIFGIRLAWVDRVARYQSMPIPYSLVTLSLVTASISMCFSTLQKIWRALRDLAGKDSAGGAGGDPGATVMASPGKGGQP
jgi:TRAP-type C4-dicarboxylate transport system permease small subunit